MCLIIASPNGSVPSQDILKQGWRSNSDGWGLMQSDGKNLTVNKGLKYNELEKLIENLNGNPFVIHYRWATHGVKNIDNCHPFKITRELYMAHNGVINIDCSNKAMSDTWHFAKELRRMGVDQISIKDGEIVEAIGKLIGNSNKLTFLDSKGNVTIVNEKIGQWEKDIWYSNTHSFYTESSYRYSRYYSSAYSKYTRHRYSATEQTYKHSAEESQDANSNFAWDNWDEGMYADGSDLWNQCEYCNTLDWLEEVPECDGMILCAPCKKVLIPIYTAPANVMAYDSNGVPYSWDDIDDKIIEVRNAYEFKRSQKAQ